MIAQEVASLQLPGVKERRLVLVRHARPDIDPLRPAGEWPLAAGAAASVERLAASLDGLGADGVITSPEPKAAATARILSTALDLPLSEDDAFREQGGDGIPWFDDPAEFHAAVANHFARHDAVVFGAESSSMAALRFANGVERSRSMYRYPIVVTHGRVMCGYLRRATGVDPMTIWPSLQMPDALAVVRDAGTIARVTGEGLIPLYMKETS
jgi:broad specificity phosphatase PhoE